MWIRYVIFCINRLSEVKYFSIKTTKLLNFDRIY
jgi:hypothetical protein